MRVHNKIAHIITSLSTGGAEAVLTRLVTRDTSNIHEVIVLMDKGVYGDILIKSGIQVYTLNMASGRIRIRDIVELYRCLRNIKPNVVQTWMFHADMLGGVVAKVLGVKKIFWGVHAANIKLLTFKTKIVVRICSLLSYFIPTKIVCCAYKTKDVFTSNLYSSKKLTVIYNGFDLMDFTNGIKNIELRLLDDNLKSGDILIGFVARWDIHKDIPNLLAALKIAITSFGNIKCLFVGEGLDKNNKELCTLIEHYELSSNIVLLGIRRDIPNLMRTIDLYVLSSTSEAFPNVLVESMACGTPCVATDVGDVKYIISETGWIVGPSDYKTLADSIIMAIKEMKNEIVWSQRKINCRDRIINKFSLEKMVNNYVSLWNQQ